MEHILDDVEVRILGALIEKEITTPDYYPLSLNALTLACNQSSNRYPVVHFDDDTVGRAADRLRAKGLIHLIERGESRVTKYRHVLYEACDLGRPSIAVLCLLMLRGPQTVGEIRTRSNRLYDFSSLEEVEMTLTSMMSRETRMVARLPRQSGQKEDRFAHRLSGDPLPVEAERLDGEIDRIARLEKEIEDLKRQFEQFRRQFE